MSAKARSAATLACALLTSSCYVLGIDFDKKGVTSSSSAGGSGGGSTTTGTGATGPGGGGAGGGTAAPDCGGIDLLGTLANSPYYRIAGTLSTNGCNGVWDGVADTVKLALPAGGAAQCRVGSNWFFDGRGRRYAAHLTTAPAAIAMAPAGLFALDQNGFEILALIHSDGSVWLSTVDLGTSVTIDTGPIDVVGDTFLALRFSNDGATATLESGSQPDVWNDRATVDLSPFSKKFDPSSLRVGVVQIASGANTTGGTADFGSLRGETVEKPSPPAVACPVSSLKASFNVQGLPDTLADPGNCAIAGGVALRVCSSNAKACTVTSRHLYDLAGSRLDVQVSAFSADPTPAVDVAVFSPLPGGAVVPFAQMRLTPTDLQVGGNTLQAGAGALPLPVFLDMVDDGTGSLKFGTHATAGAMPSFVMPTLPIAKPQIVELRFIVPSPKACATLDSLGLP